MNSRLFNVLFFGLCLAAIGCGSGTPEIPPVTEAGENASEAEMQKRIEESKKMGGAKYMKK